MREGLRSLNVAMAVAMVAGEALRQTGGSTGDSFPIAMKTPWLRSALPAGKILFFGLAFTTVSEAAWLNRNLLGELLARAPVAPGSQPTLDAARVEACLRSARDLDGLAGALDQLMIVIQDTAARIEYSRHLEDRPQLPRPDRTENQTRAQHEGGIAERAELQQIA